MMTIVLLAQGAPAPPDGSLQPPQTDAGTDQPCDMGGWGGWNSARRDILQLRV